MAVSLPFESGWPAGVLGDLCRVAKEKYKVSAADLKAIRRKIMGGQPRSRAVGLARNASDAWPAGAWQYDPGVVR